MDQCDMRLLETQSCGGLMETLGPWCFTTKTGYHGPTVKINRHLKSLISRVKNVLVGVYIHMYTQMRASIHICSMMCVLYSFCILAVCVAICCWP